MKYDILVQTFTSSLVRKQYLPFLAQKLENFFLSKSVSGYYKTKKKKKGGPLSHWRREGKTLVVRPLKKNTFLCVTSLTISIFYSLVLYLLFFNLIVF